MFLLGVIECTDIRVKPAFFTKVKSFKQVVSFSVNYVNLPGRFTGADIGCRRRRCSEALRHVLSPRVTVRHWSDNVVMNYTWAFDRYFSWQNHNKKLWLRFHSVRVNVLIWGKSKSGVAAATVFSWDAILKNQPRLYIFDTFLKDQIFPQCSCQNALRKTNKIDNGIILSP